MVKAQNNENIDSLYNIARNYYRNGDYSNADRYFNEILNIKGKIRNDIQPEYFKVFNWLGLVYYEKGYLKKAIENYNSALKHTSIDFYRTIINGNIANVYSLLGDYSKAISYLENSLSILEKSNHSERFVRIADNYHNQAYAYYKLGQLKPALQKSLKSIQIAGENNLFIDGTSYSNCGLIYQGLDSLDKAGLYFKKAIKAYESEFGATHYMTAMAYLSHAVFYAETEMYSKSEKLFDKSYNILIKSLGFKHYYTFLCLKNKGDLFYKKLEYPTALRYYQQALMAKIYEFNDTSIYSNPGNDVYPDLDLLDLLNAKAHALGKLATIENRQQNLMAALQTLELSAGFIEQLRTGYLYESSKLQLAAREHDTYISIVSIAYALYQVTGNMHYAETAFNYAELSKYAVLRELENEEKAMEIAGIPDSLQTKERELKEQITYLGVQLKNENELQKPDTKKIGEYRQNIFELSRKLDALKEKLETGYPLYYKQKYQSPAANSTQIQKSIPAKNAVLEYVLTDSALFTFVVTNEHFVFDKQTTDTAFYKNLDYYTNVLYSDYVSDYYKYRDAAFYLYKKLISPYENTLTGKNLVIIPDNKLLQISFDAFIYEPLNKTIIPDPRKESYLIKKYALSYAYSATLYQNSSTKKGSFFQRFLGIAPGYENSKDSLVDLPLGLKNIKRIALLTFGKSFTGNKATKKVFKENAPESDIIHFYAHGIEDTLSPASSKLYLSPSDTTDTGYLYAWEIYNMQLQANLVVLATCYSGSGKLSKGEGLLSIARSFTYAGSKSIITSLWVAAYKPVNSILNNFYKYSFKGMSKSESLQRAKLKFLEETNSYSAHPKFWSGIVLYGNSEPLYHAWYLKRIVVGLLVFVFIGIAIKKRKSLFKLF